MVSENVTFLLKKAKRNDKIEGSVTPHAVPLHLCTKCENQVLYLVKSFISEKFTKLLCTLLCLSFALFSCSRADSEKTKSAPWSFIVAVKAASAENNSQCEKKLDEQLWTNQQICVLLKFWWNGLGWEMLNKVVGLQGIKLHWEREVRVKSRQRKRRRYDDKSFILI